MGKRGPNADNWIIRFWRYVEKTENCWLWVGLSKGHPYGTIKVGNRGVGAHRASYELHYGAFERSLHVLHKCDNPRCVRPDHLFLGTHQANMKDRNKKGRFARLAGEKNGEHVLIEKQILKIRRSRPKVSVKELATLYGVSVACIEDVIYRRTWKHVQ